MKKIKPLLPKYAVIPVLIMVIINFITYTVTKYITDGGHHFDISLPIDDYIPFLPVFIIIYVVSYAQWVIGFGMIAKESKEVCYRVISSEIISKLICLIIFLCLPTMMTRPEITGNDIFSRLTALIYSLDTPTNLFPSVHCLESWILFRTAPKITRHGKWVTPAWFVFAILVFASVLFVRQHLVLDIPAAIIISEIGLFVGRKFKTERIFEKINSKFLKAKEQNH